MTQAEGVVPTSKHYLAPYCTEDDIPPGRLLDSNGATLGDVPIGLCICAATDALFKRTRRKFRSGRSVVRPSQIVNPNWGGSMLYPYRSMAGYGESWGMGDFAWSAFGVGWWQGDNLSEVVLQAPVRRINSVTVDGEVLPPESYTLYDRRRLVRSVTAGSPGAWPWNQPLSMGIDQPGTWQIDYEWGRQVTTLGQLACVELTVALVQGLSGQDAAGLPARVQRVASQGVDVAVGDALQFLLADFTGLPIVDLFIGTENPTHSRHRSRFVSPSSVLNRST